MLFKLLGSVILICEFIKVKFTNFYYIMSQKIRIIIIMWYCINLFYLTTYIVSTWFIIYLNKSNELCD